MKSRMDESLSEDRKKEINRSIDRMLASMVPEFICGTGMRTPPNVRVLGLILLGFSPVEIARRVGVNPRTIIRWKNNKGAMPRCPRADRALKKLALQNGIDGSVSSLRRVMDERALTF